MHLREQHWAGDVVLVGEEPVLPYERPPLSKTFLTDACDPPVVLTEALLEEHRIRFIPGVGGGQLHREAHHLRLSDGEILPYEKLLLTTGAAARKLSCPGGDHAYTLRDLGDAQVLRERLAEAPHVVLIGAGFIGLELAAAVTQGGGHVTVLEANPEILERVVPRAVAQVVADAHRNRGVDLRCGVTVEQISKQSGRYTVGLAGGEEVVADLVVAGVGAVPNTTLAAEAGLQVENGVAVDAFLQSSDPDIFAAGDCCSFPHALYQGQRVRLEMWRNAREQAECAVRNLIGGREEFRQVPWFWSDQYDLSLQVAGLPAYAAHHVSRVRPDGVILHFGLNAGNQLVFAAGVGVGNSVAKDIRLAERAIGAQKAVDPDQLADPSFNLKQIIRG